jgi:hypothetical protein
VGNLIEHYLERHGPCLTSEISDYLTRVHHVTPAAARKRVSRAGLPIRKLSFITFPHKARFVYLERDFGSPRYWRSLESALLATKSAYGLAIAALRERGGLMPAGHFQIACGAPIKQLRHLSPDTILKRLIRAGLLEVTNVGGLGECVTLAQEPEHFEKMVASVRARLITESLLLKAMKEWIRNLNIGSYDSVATRDDEKVPQVGTFVWDLSAPSFLGPLLKYAKDGTAKNGFVVCDVLLGPEIDVNGIQPFIHKCQTLRRLRNVGPCLQIFVADRFTREAFLAAKQNGIIPATSLNLFGKEVAEGLTELTTVLREAAQSIIDPEKFEHLFNKLGKIEGATNQLRGTLFEFIVAEIAKRTMPANVRMNRKYKSPDGKRAEADVVILKEDIDIMMIECKGYSPYAEIPDSLFKRWLQHNVPVCYNSIRAHPEWQNLPARFEFWTTGSLSAESMALIESANATVNPRKYTLEVKFNAQIYEACKATQDVALIEVFERHYMKAVVE